MPRKKYPRYTYHRSSEGCDDLWMITDNATGAELACSRFWEKADEREVEVKNVVNWLNAHAEGWMCRKAAA